MPSINNNIEETEGIATIKIANNPDIGITNRYDNDIESLKKLLLIESEFITEMDEDIESLNKRLVLYGCLSFVLFLINMILIAIHFIL